VTADPARRPRAAAWRILRWLGLALAVAAAIASTWLSTRSHPAPIHYQTATVDHGPVAAKVTANGALSALVTVSVGSQVSGRIDSLRADFGSRVKQGEVIATIEPSMFVAAVRQARANRAAALATLERAKAQRVNAERQYARQKSLLAQRLVAEADYDAAEAALGVARADVQAAAASASQALAALEQAELNLRYTTIVSPIDGVVISRNVDVGQTVAATLQAPTLFSIAHDLTRMQVDTNVAEADVGKIHGGMQVSFGVDAYPGRALSGTVRQVRDNAQTLQNVVTYDAVIDVDNSERLLKPGMTATVTFVYAQRADVLRVPNAALRFKPDRATLALLEREAPREPSATDERVLWLLRDGRAEPVRVRVGISDGVSTEVLAGDVHAGDRAVVEANGDAKPAG
jgi:HlyD family secretion protein